CLWTESIGCVAGACFAREAVVASPTPKATLVAEIGTKGVTMPALAPRARADTNAGLATVDDVCLATRQLRVSEPCSQEVGHLRRGCDRASGGRARLRLWIGI